MIVDNRLREPLARAIARPLGDWQPWVDAWRESREGRSLEIFVDARVAARAVVYPDEPLRALRLTRLARTRVVIAGQDPYHGAGQAEGLAFSVPAGVPLPPSLRNIFRELQRDCGVAAPQSGHLGAWASRGVLLLNSVLTVEEGLPGRHARHGWEALTDRLIDAAIRDPRPKVFMLWGAHAQELAPRVQAAGRHLVLTASHPSPLSATRGTKPFAGCAHFSQASAFLAEHRDPDGPLDWTAAPA